jgi:hypothetical protein
MKYGLLVSMMLMAGSVANAEPDSRPMPAPPPDGPGVRRRPEPADNRRIVGVLPVRVEGLPDNVKDSFQRIIEDQIDTKQYWLAPRSRMKQMLMRSTKWTEGCIVGPCIAEVRVQTGAEIVLDTVLTGSRTSFGYIVTLIRTDTGRVVQQDAARCDACTVNEAMNRARLAVVGLLNNLPDKLPDEAAEQGAAIDIAVGKAEHDVATQERHTTRLGIVLTATGLVGAIVGAVAYETQGRPSYAVPVAIGGGALALGGVVVLAF